MVHLIQPTLLKIMMAMDVKMMTEMGYMMMERMVQI
jgi:hypothetical protein